MLCFCILRFLYNSKFLCIHDIDRISLDKCLHIGCHLLVEALTSLVGSPGDVRGKVSIWLAKEWILLLWRLLLHYVGTVGTQFAGMQGSCHGVLIHQWSTTRIHQDGGVLHLLQTLLIDEMIGVICQWAVEGEDVAHG